MSALGLIQRGAPLVAALKSAGLDPDEEDDFTQIRRRVREVGNDVTHPMMSIERNDFVKGEAFWLFLRRDGRDVASLGATFVDLSNETLESYWRRTSQHQYGRDIDPILAVDPMLGLLRGKMVYVGELYVHESIRGDVRNLARYTRLMQLMIAYRWTFDWMYGFVSDDHTKLNRLYQFSLTVRRAITWAQPEPQGRLNSHTLLASPYRQIMLLFEQGTGQQTGS